MRFVSAYGNPLTSKLCAALSIGESCALASVIYAIAFMVYTRLYDLKKTSIGYSSSLSNNNFINIMDYLLSFLWYTIYDKLFKLSCNNNISTSNITSYCTTYTTSIYHPPWMAYTEIGIIYSFPFLSIFIGLSFLIHHLCQRRPKGLDLIQRKYYLEQKQMTWHVVILSLTFIFLWLPWIIFRIIIIFHNTKQIQQALQITYYILILKSVIFPILYASTNSSFRGSFAIYRHKRITIIIVYGQLMKISILCLYCK